MHELTICQALIEQVEGVARARGSPRVLAMVVRLGPLSGVEPDQLRSAYSLCNAGTLAADAQLVLEQTHVRVRCLQCDAESDVTSNRLLCHKCGHWRVQVLTGEELLLVSVELEKPQAVCHV